MKAAFQNFWLNVKYVAADRVDLIMFLIIATLAALDLFGLFHRAGSLGFAAAYLFFVLMRMGILRKENEALKNPKP